MSTANRLMLSLCIGVSPLVLAGCGSSYEQPVAGDCATIRVASDTAYISKVDGTSTTDGATRTMLTGLGFLAGDSFPTGQRQVAVTPGKHTIQIEGLDLRADFWLVAAPKVRYVVKFGRPTGYGQSVWMEDARTGEVVGGIRGSVDEPPDE